MMSNGRITEHPKVHKLQIKLSKMSSARRLYENIDTKELHQIYLKSISNDLNSSSTEEKKPSNQVYFILDL